MFLTLKIIKYYHVCQYFRIQAGIPAVISLIRHFLYLFWEKFQKMYPY